jgi:hypothetical protein
MADPLICTRAFERSQAGLSLVHSRFIRAYSFDFSHGSLLACPSGANESRLGIPGSRTYSLDVFEIRVAMAFDDAPANLRFRVRVVKINQRDPENWPAWVAIVR